MSCVDWDVSKFEANLERQIKFRRLINHRTNNNFEENYKNGKIFDQFLIIGYPPHSSKKTEPDTQTNENKNEKKRKEKILVCYPPIELPGINYERIISFTFPSGIHRKYLRKNGIEPLQDEFLFSIGGNNDDLFYGVCVHISLLKSPTPFFARKSKKTTTYAFLILSRSPSVSCHFNFLSYMALNSLMHFEMNRLPESVNILFDGDVLMHDMIIDEMIGHVKGIEVPEFFANNLKFYYTQTPISPPIELGKSTYVYMDPNVSHDCLLWCSLDTLFSILSVDIIVQLVSLLILDSQILVIGSSLQEVSMVIIALQHIVKPFEFCGQVIPILPNEKDFLSLLESPTPFLIGVAPYPALSSFVFLDTAIFVQLDKHNVSLQADVQYPNFKNIVKNVSSIIKKEKAKVSHPFGFTDALVNKERKYRFSPDTCIRIRQAILQPLESLTSDDIFGFFVTDINSAGGQGTTIFNAELFLASIKKEDQLYFRMLIDSQVFQVFIEDKICEYLYKTRGPKGLVHPMTTEIVISQEASVQKTRTRSKSIHKEILCVDEL